MPTTSVHEQVTPPLKYIKPQSCILSSFPTQNALQRVAEFELFCMPIKVIYN